MEGSLVRPTLPSRVTIREVGPRDGLQSEPPLPVEARVHVLDVLSRCGFSKIEAVAFVSPTLVPSMAGAADVWAGVTRAPGVAYSALVPNRRGAEDAVAAGGFASLQAFLAASDGYNQHNVGKSVKESIEDVRDVVTVARQAGVPVECSVSSAFGDPFDGDVPPARVVEVVRWLIEAGVGGVSLGDTTGVATPTRVWDVIGTLRSEVPDLRLNLHFHDTRGTALANVLAALQAGCDEFDASVGGLGGSPFAPGAGGNVATEDLVSMLDDMDIETGIDLAAVVGAAVDVVAPLVGHELRSQASRSGPR